MSIIRVQNKGQVTLPTAVRQQLGIATGDLLEVQRTSAGILLKPKALVDRTAADEYTPAQRQAIDRELAKGAADVKAGRVYGPFSTADETIASLQANLKKRAAVKKLKPAR